MSLFFSCSTKYPWNEVPKALWVNVSLSKGVVHEQLVVVDMILGTI